MPDIDTGTKYELTGSRGRVTSVDTLERLLADKVNSMAGRTELSVASDTAEAGVTHRPRSK